MNNQAWLVLTEGFLSFFSPCVLPILPVYMAYLSQDALKKDLTGWRARHLHGILHRGDVGEGIERLVK